MSKFVNIKKGERLRGTTFVKQTEVGEQVIQTELAVSVELSDDPGAINLQVGRRHRGSILPFILEDGRLAFRFQPFRQAEESRPQPENLHTTSHGRIYRNTKSTRVVFEFPANASFAQISDALDDECYELREFLDREDA